MLLSGFTFIRNAKKYDFPIIECIESMLPIVDELIVNVGQSDDGTEELIASIKSPKIKIIRSVWDDTKTSDGLVLSEQTNIALDACQGRWCLYLQADECLHQDELESLRAQIEEADKQQSSIDGFRFRYLHFYGGYSLIQRPWNWYPSEIRVIRKASGLRSYGDAQSFRADGRDEPFTPLLNAHIFHYGHARSPETMAQKIRYFHRFWHGDKHGIEVKQAYTLDHRNLVWYWGTHPKTYAKRVSESVSWSPFPSRVAGPIADRIVIFSDRANLELARKVHELIESKKHTGTHVELVLGWRGWLKCFFGSSFARNASALVDLTAETRSTANFLCWIWDALTAYRWRVAHSPHGTLSRFRARFYSAVNWGTHEKTKLGFVVPEDQHPRQLARWLGFDV